jgi:transcriptional regulator with XRE-family HTH domain
MSDEQKMMTPRMTGSVPPNETIGERLKRLRIERGLSQRDLGSPGVSYAYISRIEAGTRQPSVKALRRLAAKLGVSPEYLETGSDIDPAEARELRLADAELALRLEHSAEAEETVQRLLEEAVGAGDRVNAARARVTLAYAAFERGAYGDAIALLEDAVAEGSVSPVEQIEVYATLGRAYAMTGAASRAVELFERCCEEVEQVCPGDVALQVRYSALLSYALSDLGELGRAERVVKEALERAGEIKDDPYMRVRLYWSLARLAEMEGKSAEALHNVRRAIALLETTDDTIHLAQAHLLCAWIMTSKGDPTNALRHVDKAETLLGTHASAEDRAHVAVERARALAGAERGADAVALAREAIELLEGSDPSEVGAATAALAEGLALQGEWDEADPAFRRAIDLLSEQRRWRAAAHVAQTWGRLLRKAGREAAAFDALERATELGLRAAPAPATSAR